MWQAFIEHLLYARPHSKHYPWHNLLATHTLTDEETEAPLSHVTGWGLAMESNSSLSDTSSLCMLSSRRFAGHRNGWWRVQWGHLTPTVGLRLGGGATL